MTIKLDMSKAYDWVAWPFMFSTFNRLGFCENWINLIYRFISNNWYSLIVNGSRHGFFKSERGLRQGDPLSPSLFIMSAEQLSQMLNNFNSNPKFRGYYMHPQGPQITHMSFVDDTIIFCSSLKHSLNIVRNN